MYTLENNKLKIAVKKIGAELCKISSIKGKREFMWNANPEIWKGVAPNLFPIIGALKNDTYIYDNQKFNMPKHGFVRKSKDIELFAQTKDSLTFKLITNEALFKIYPFKFEFFITYKLSNNCINITHTIKNCDNKPMYFSVGGHPAFKCPVYDDENYNDYSLEFENLEHAKTHLLNLESGLVTSKTKAVFNDTKHIQLKHDLFNNDALIFKDLTSRKVTLKSKLHGAILSVSFKDFPYLGIWAKPNANYVCIEPWLGIADHEDTNQDLKHKEGILTLNANDTFKASYSIEIHDHHLV
jgi:galactose mutarotase-like enzyme